MARMALIAIAALPLWASCASTGDNRFAEPNAIMGEEIDERIAQIPFQHREGLFHNLLWLSQAGEQSIPALLRGLRHNDPKVRSNCSWVLAQIGDRRVIDDLRALTTDENETVRLEASRSLVLLGDMQQCPPLIDALDSEKVQVRYLCHEALKDATGQDFGFDHLSDDMSERRRTVLSWREWWGEMSGDPWFANSYATQHGLAEPAEAAPEIDAMPPASPLFESGDEPGFGEQGQTFGTQEQGFGSESTETPSWEQTESTETPAVETETNTNTGGWGSGETETPSTTGETPTNGTETGTGSESGSNEETGSSEGTGSSNGWKEMPLPTSTPSSTTNTPNGHK